MGGSAVARPDESPAKKALITGFAVLLEMGSGGLFMENVKMEKQRTSAPYPTIMKNILSQGLRGYEAGLWPWGVILGVTKGTVLGGSKAKLDTMLKNQGVEKKTADLIAGFGAGAVQGVFMSPILLARTRVNQSITERAQSGAKPFTVAQELAFSQRVLFEGVKNEGPMMLTTGMGACVPKRALDWGTRFIFINQCRRFLIERQDGKKLNDMQNLGTAFVGGALSVTVTMPIDRLMPVIQQAGGGKSIISVIKESLAKEGITTMQRGWAMRTIHTGYHTTFAIFVADKVMEVLSK